ncbi:hypothetical protein KA005_29775 [bacterium]|nr:hypothetical protein [bacterium]
MRLYNIRENDVLTVIRKGKREILSDGKISVVHDLRTKFKYPIKVVGVQTDKALLIVTVYPLKKRREPK